MGIEHLLAWFLRGSLVFPVFPSSQESLVLFDRAGGLPHIALQLPVPPKETLPKEAGD